MRISPIFLILPACLTIGACTAQQRYYSAQSWQRNECEKLIEKTEREQRRHQKLEHKHADFTAEHPPEQFESDDIERKRASIEAALARARARRGKS